LPTVCQRRHRVSKGSSFACPTRYERGFSVGRTREGELHLRDRSLRYNSLCMASKCGISPERCSPIGVDQDENLRLHGNLRRQHSIHQCLDASKPFPSCRFVQFQLGYKSPRAFRSQLGESRSDQPRGKGAVFAHLRADRNTGHRTHLKQPPHVHNVLPSRTLSPSESFQYESASLIGEPQLNLTLSASARG